jgi:RNAse (barnase) inhibitor barstar
MRTFEFDTKSWSAVLDVYEAICEALESSRWHGHSIDALIDSMVYGGINGIEPPYTLRFLNVEGACPDVRNEITDIATYVGEALVWRLAHYGNAPTIVFQIAQ